MDGGKCVENDEVKYVAKVVVVEMIDSKEKYTSMWKKSGSDVKELMEATDAVDELENKRRKAGVERWKHCDVDEMHVEVVVDVVDCLKAKSRGVEAC